MLIKNDNHFHTPYVVVRLSALYKKTWILIRLRIRMKMITIFMYKMYNNITMYKLYLTVENLWKTLQDLWKTLRRVWKLVDVTYITPTCKIIISL